MRDGIADTTGRLLTAPPVLRRSWLAAVVFLLLATVGVVHTAGSPPLFLALAPLLPLAGVALSYGPALDPTYEMAVVAPLHGFRLLMIRTLAVLAAGLGLNGLATLPLPGHRLRRDQLLPDSFPPPTPAGLEPTGRGIFGSNRVSMSDLFPGVACGHAVGARRRRDAREVVSLSVGRQSRCPAR